MIIEALMEVFMMFFTAVMGVVYGVFPGVPDWFSSILLTLIQLMGWVGQLDHWVNTSLAFIVAGAVMAAWLISMVIQIVRMAVSYLTLGGGAT